MNPESRTPLRGDDAVELSQSPADDRPTGADPATGSDEPVGLRCKNHHGTETYLCCGKCGEPICAKCVVITPVGARCRECARLRRLPTFQLAPKDYLRALGSMLGSAVIVGALAGLLRSSVAFGTFLIPIAIGFLVGEAVALATNRKRATPLKLIAGLGVLLAYSLQPLGILLAASSPLALASLGQLALATLIAALASPFALLALAIGVLIAVNRF